MDDERRNPAPDTAIERMRAISNTAQVINTPLELDQLLDVILQEAQKLTGAERGTVYLVDRDAAEIISIVTEGGEKLRISLPFGRGFAGIAASTGRTINIENAYDDPRFNPEVDRETGFKTRSVLTMPIRNPSNEIVGVIQLLNKADGPFSRDDEELINTFGVHASIAIERTRMTEAMLRTRSLAAVGNLAASIIHDLKSPLTVIQGYVDLLNFSLPTEEQKNHLSHISSQLNRMVGMTQEVLDFARGQIRIRPEKTMLRTYIEEMCASIRQEMVRREISLDFEAPDGPDVEIILDRNRFARVFHNLVTNAREAMPDGGWLAVKLSVDDEHWQLTIEDSGVGISRPRLETIFEPFSTFGKAHGTGLGLTIARNVILEHGGEIDVDSDEGMGTRFFIRMPIRPPVKAIHNMPEEG